MDNMRFFKIGLILAWKWKCRIVATTSLYLFPPAAAVRIFVKSSLPDSLLGSQVAVHYTWVTPLLSSYLCAACYLSKYKCNEGGDLLREYKRISPIYRWIYSLKLSNCSLGGILSLHIWFFLLLGDITIIATWLLLKWLLNLNIVLTQSFWICKGMGEDNSYTCLICAT